MNIKAQELLSSYNKENNNLSNLMQQLATIAIEKDDVAIELAMLRRYSKLRKLDESGSDDYRDCLEAYEDRYFEMVARRGMKAIYAFANEFC